MITLQTYHIHGILMKRIRIPVLAAALLVAASAGQAQEANVYASVLATKLFVVGAANPLTGLRPCAAADPSPAAEAAVADASAGAAENGSGGSSACFGCTGPLHCTSSGAGRKSTGCP